MVEGVSGGGAGFRAVVAADQEAASIAANRFRDDGRNGEPDHPQTVPGRQLYRGHDSASNAVVRSFYAFWIERGEGPLVNPVLLARGRGRRPHTHHNPLESFRPEGRLRYNPPAPKRRPRAMLDERWEQLFTAMRSDRDRAILALAVSTGARAGALLGMRGIDLD
ncbi:hypothetical protein Ga0074812_12522 [Parafrankia irregularis]|uniref:Tyr recombinase domain-containing protein n=1 Tax=Parafrankia irregularis TaxID=795642 RepID=A0A0S4QUD7_9ACTN|nr:MULTISPECIES: hypothetical protein [Frankiaceae]CUU59133.1 hypothetical protein Ga0074812_12522 [Parafrankia irregularis]